VAMIGKMLKLSLENIPPTWELLNRLRGRPFINYQIIGPTVSICIAHQSLAIYYEALLKAI